MQHFRLPALHSGLGTEGLPVVADILNQTGRRKTVSPLSAAQFKKITSKAIGPFETKTILNKEQKTLAGVSDRQV
jgi:hypothetical protein